MIRVTVELDSANGSARDRILGTAEIVNDGTGDGTHGNYVARFYGAPSKAWNQRLWRETRLMGWARKRHHPWLLILFCLLKAVGDEQVERIRHALRRSGGAAHRKEQGHA